MSVISSPTTLQTPPIRLLLADPDVEFGQRLRRLLDESGAAGFAVRQVPDLPAALAALDEQTTDIVLVDILLANSDWQALFSAVRARARRVPLVVLSSQDDETTAVRAVHEGAQDYLVKTEMDRATTVRALRYSIEREQSEQALAQAEAKYRSIFEHISEGIFQTSPDGHYLSANPALARIYGYASVEEMIRTVTNIRDQLYVDPARRPEFVRLMEERDVVAGFDSQIYRKDGSIIWISENVRAVRDAQGAIQYYEGTVEDITERKRAQEELSNSEALYHSLVENLPQYIFRKDLAGRFTFANQRFCQTLGKKLEDILGRSDFDFYPPELAAKYQRDDRVIMESGRMMEIVEEYQPAEGGTLYITVVKTPLRDAAGRIIGLQGIFWDITEKKRAEEGLRQTTLALDKSRRELQAKNEELEEDLRMAREIQLAIIPQQYPSFPRAAAPADSALRFTHRYLPTGTVGGDFFSIVPLSDTKAGIFIGDVMGHGVRSALITAIIRTLVEELTPIAINPGQLLGQINKELRSILKQSGTVLYTTAFYGVLDLEKHVLTYANAGHPKPFLLNPAADQVEALPLPGGRGSAALGLFDHTLYPVAECPVPASCTLMLFTDGLYDVDGAQQDTFTFDWLLAQARAHVRMPPERLFDRLIESLRQASEGRPLADDICAVGVEVLR